MIAESRALTKAYMGKKVVKEVSIYLWTFGTKWQWKNDMDENDDRVYQTDTWRGDF